MSWYRAGSVTTTIGSAVVTGVGTAFIANASIGEALLAPDGNLYEIQAVNSDTQLTLASVVSGNYTAQPYVIVPTQSYIRDLASQAATLVNSYSTFYANYGSGFPDGTVGTPGFKFSNDTDTGIYRIGANNLGVSIGGVKKVDIGAALVAFAVGVSVTGAVSATGELSLTASGGGSADLTLGSNTASGYSRIFMKGNSGQTNWKIGSNDSENNVLEITPSTAAAGSTYTTPVIKVSTTGLAVTGALSATASGANSLSVVSTASSVDVNLQCADTGSVTINAGGTSNPNKGRLLYSDNSDFWAFYTGGTENMRLDASGNLKVGHTGTRTGIVGYYATGDVISSHSGAASGGATSLFTGWHSATASTTGTLAFNVTSNGNVTNINNSYGAISDVKLKENITDATPKLDSINQVRVVNYNLIGDGTKQLGVIANELELLFPGMVEETPDRDQEGNDLGTTTKSVKYSVFVPMLIKAVQELTARVAQLESAA